MAKPFSLQIFLPFGEPSGLRIIDRPNWTGQGIAFPRSRVKQALAAEELQRTGVYILWNSDEALTVPQAYVGQSERVSDRIWSHEHEREFWTDGVAFTTKDESLNRAHVSYLESRLIQIATEAGRCTLENRNTPMLPILSRAAAADAEQYLDDLLDCLPIIGLRFFQPMERRIASEEVAEERLMLKLDHSNSKEERLRGVVAYGYELVDGFVILKDSLVAREESSRWVSRYEKGSQLRAELLEDGVLTIEGAPPNAYRFTRDHVFNSPSAAAGIVRAASGSGRDYWIDEAGRSLKELEELEVGGRGNLP